MDLCNQEDSLLVKKSAIERGLFTVTSYRTLTEEEKKHETICLPPFDKRKHNANYGFLNERGIVRQRIGIYNLSLYFLITK